MTPCRNGSASDSRTEGCVFKSRRGQLLFLNLNAPGNIFVYVFNLLNICSVCLWSVLPLLLVLLVLPPHTPVMVSFYTERYVPNLFAFLLLHKSSLFATGSVADPDPRIHV